MYDVFDSVMIESLFVGLQVIPAFPINTHFRIFGSKDDQIVKK